MNLLNKKNTLILLILVTGITFAQSRNNKETIPEIKNTNFLKKIKGWYFNDENGKWIENQNMIYSESAEMRYSFAKNLDSMTINKISFKQKHYYTLMIYKETGYYEYPALKQDWKTVRGIKYIIFEESDYIKIENSLKQFSEEKILIDIFSYGELNNRFDKLSNTRILIDIEKNIEKVESDIKKFKEKWDTSKSLRRRNNNDFKKYYYESNYKAYRHYFPISSQKIENKEIIRFLFTVDDYDVENYDILKEYYFEAEKLEFEKIFIK